MAHRVVSAVQRHVRSWGQTGSDRPTLKTALLTRTGPRTGLNNREIDKQWRDTLRKQRSQAMKKVAAIVALTLVFLFGSSAFAQATSTPYAMGGSTRGFAQERDQFARSGQLFRIEGHCQSACTMFLKLKNVCVDPNAELLFHAGKHSFATKLMLESYNSRLRGFLMANHYMDGPEFHAISGREIIQRFGYRQCPGT
jgi:hypothetical protein